MYFIFITADLNVTNLFDLSYDQINTMKKKDLVNHTEYLKGKVTVDATVKKLCNEISQLSTLVNNLMTENGKISSQLMCVSNVNTLLVTCVTELEKQQVKMEQYSRRNNVEISGISNLVFEISGIFACGIFVDLQKAFDMVEHDILLTKLEHYGVRGLANDWFKSYLSDRKQFVSINGHDSNLASVLYGVPQGSVLGPLLFLIYINDLNQAIKFCKVHDFADLTQTYFTSVNL